MTQEQARHALIAAHHAERCGCGYDDCERWADIAFTVDAFLSSSTDVLAAAMGGTARAEYEPGPYRRDDHGYFYREPGRNVTIITLPGKERE